MRSRSSTASDVLPHRMARIRNWAGRGVAIVIGKRGWGGPSGLAMVPAQPQTVPWDAGQCKVDQQKGDAGWREQTAVMHDGIGH